MERSDSEPKPKGRKKSKRKSSVQKPVEQQTPWKRTPTYNQCCEIQREAERLHHKFPWAQAQTLSVGRSPLYNDERVRSEFTKLAKRTATLVGHNDLKGEEAHRWLASTLKDFWLQNYRVSPLYGGTLGVDVIAGTQDLCFKRVFEATASLFCHWASQASEDKTGQPEPSDPPTIEEIGTAVEAGAQKTIDNFRSYSERLQEKLEARWEENNRQRDEIHKLRMESLKRKIPDSQREPDSKDSPEKAQEAESPPSAETTATDGTKELDPTEQPVTVEDIKTVLETCKEVVDKKALKKKRREAVALWKRLRKSSGKLATNKDLHDHAQQDPSEFYRWQRGGLPNGSQADQDIREALTTDWD